MGTRRTVTLVEVIDLIKQIEFNLSKFYLQASGKFPADRNFWIRLHEEEDNHGRLISELREVVEKNPADFKLGKYKVQKLENYLDAIENQALRLQLGEMDRVAAFIASVDFENSFVEMRPFEAIVSDNQRFIVIREALMRETKEHRQRIRNYLALPSRVNR